MKILGQILSNKDNDDEHINKRKKAKNVMLGRIQAMNLNSKEAFNIFYILIYI